MTRRLTGRPELGVLFVAIAALVWGVSTLSRYGVTCDAPALYYAGDRTLFALLHPNAPSALDLNGEEPNALEFHSEFGRTPDVNDPVHYPVLPGLVCAVTNAIVHVKLGWLDPIDGHQVGLVLLHAVGLLLYGRYAIRVLGGRAGVLATVFLATFPSALGHSFNNAKDWPCALFYGVTVLSAAAGVLERRATHLLAAGVFLGIALSCKLNGLFALVTVALWAPLAYFAIYFRRRTLSVGVVGALLSMPYMGLAFFFVAWPWLHHGPLREWWRNLDTYFGFMLDFAVNDRAHWTTYPLRCLSYMTPPVVLGLGLAYAVLGLRRTRLDVARWALLLLWTALPIVRTSAPHANFYDANRHFIEYIPALCAMAGAGASRVAGIVGGWLARAGTRTAWRAALAGAAVVALGVCLVWPIAEYHPYETAYFNVFAGGLGGAQQRGVLHFEPANRANGTEGDYWWGAIREASARMSRLKTAGNRWGFCGGCTGQVDANWRKERPPIVGNESADVLYAGPRAAFCDWSYIHDLERKRPILDRVTRGGGVIYEIFGPSDAVNREPVSPMTLYDAR